MGNFLIVVPDIRKPEDADRLLEHAFGGTTFPITQHTVRRPSASAVTAPRSNGSGGSVAIDPKTTSWLVAAGTWFHARGFSAGQELLLLDRFLEVGPVRLARELDGFYVLAFWDESSETTTIITDLVGSCHAFSRRLPGGVAISSSSLLLAGLDHVELDAVGCQEFLETGVIYEDRTFYRDIRKLAPASVITLDSHGRFDSQTYWDLSQMQPECLDGDAAVDRLWEALTNAATAVTRNFSHVVCDLTGGYDSRSTVAAFLATGANFSTTVSGDENSPDARVAQSLSAIAGTRHSRFPRLEDPSIEDLHHALQFTDGECDLLEYSSTARTHLQLSKSYDISINGSFGEVARGYWWELLWPRAGARRQLDYQRIARLRFATNPSDGALFPADSHLDLPSHLAAVMKRTTSSLRYFPNTFQMDAAYLGMRMQRWQGRIASSTNRIWPCLSPFIFHSCLETMLQTKSGFRSRSLLIRAMLAKYQPALANHPLEHGYPAIPASLRTLPRFWPLVPDFASRVVRKVRQRTGLGKAEPVAARPLRLRLWDNAEIRETLEPSTMKLGQLMNPAALRRFLLSSQTPGFAYDLEWRRMLSLELSLGASALRRLTTPSADSPRCASAASF
jgi:hypothetical protein